MVDIYLVRMAKSMNFDVVPRFHSYHSYFLHHLVDVALIYQALPMDVVVRPNQVVALDAACSMELEAHVQLEASVERASVVEDEEDPAFAIGRWVLFD